MDSGKAAVFNLPAINAEAEKMAKNINKKRMRDTRILMGIVLLTGFFTVPVLQEGTWAYELFRLTGYILLTTCAIGRIHSTAFIGGIKNKTLTTVGPYSMCRNPLYFYSLLGAAGVGLMSGEIILVVILVVGFMFIYDQLIDREEEFLSQKFGDEFESYKTRTPRLIPDPAKYTCPAELVFQPRYLNNAIWDALWWFAPVPLFELARLLQHAGLLKPMFSIV
jgi:protein-S-isoprenylcysteine O-methyltransferase Ste14